MQSMFSSSTLDAIWSGSIEGTFWSKEEIKEATAFRERDFGSFSRKDPK